MSSVSIITPIKANHPAHVRWLVETVESVQGQTRDDWEMVIVDDHSKHAIPDFDDSRVTVRHLDGTRKGVSAARNLAAELALSDLLLPLDADDKLAENAVEAFLDAWKGSGVLYSDVVMFGTDFARVYLSPSYDFNTLLRATFMLVGCLHRKEDWARAGGWRTDMQMGLEDWEYWIALGELGVCGQRVPEPLYWYRRQPGGRLARLKADPQAWHKAYQRMRDLHIETFNGRRPVGCCGGSRPVAGRRNPGKPAQPAPQVRGDRVLLVYTGRRQGSFGLRGQASRVRYQVAGPGEFVTDSNGVPGVDRRDAQVFTRMGGGKDFRQARPPAQPKPKPASPPKPHPAGETVAESRAWKPDVMISERARAEELVESLDPADYSVRALRELELSPEQAAEMLAMEKAGRGRSTVIVHLERLL